MSITKFTARVFTCPGFPVGGNPVTIFFCKKSFGADLRSHLSSTCKWESVFIESEPTTKEKVFFYMPSGEEVSFCGHAALAASYCISTENTPKDNNDIQFTANVLGTTTNTVIRNGNEVELKMDGKCEELDIDKSTCFDLLEQVGVSEEQIDTNKPFLNSSVARHKTLVPLKNLDYLHSASNPSDPLRFRELCDLLQSTGLYLYSSHPTPDFDYSNASPLTASYECRQFPRASGYPEDPATGIAAASLVSSLYRRDKKIKRYQVFQVSML